MTLEFHIEQQVAHLVLNRPDVLNSFNREMAMAFQEAMTRCAEDPTIRAVHITGNGRAFCAGQDLAEASDPDGPGLSRIVQEHYNPMISMIRNLPKPVVCAINGVAAGAGANIALACDIIFAGVSASFIQAFSKIGLIPDSGGTFFLPRQIGFQRATALMMLGDKVKAQEALTMGMIYRVCADDQLASESVACARQLAAMPTKGLGYTKMALNRSLTSSLEEQLATEAELQTAAGNTNDYKEGVNAFLAKRSPQFTGA